MSGGNWYALACDEHERRRVGYVYVSVNDFVGVGFGYQDAVYGCSRVRHDYVDMSIGIQGLN